MNRKRHVLRPIKLTTTLPEDVWAKLNLHLYSQVEGRVPQGATQAFLIARINEFFDEKRRYLSDSETKVLFHLLKTILESTPQEWWIENFTNGKEAYLMIDALAKSL